MKKILSFIAIIFILFNCEVLFVEDISESEVMLISPTNGSVINLDNIRFDWQKVDEATLYNIQIATPSFQSSSQIVLDSVTSLLNLTIPLKEGDYEWRVKASNNQFETPFTTNSLTIE